MLDFDGLIFDSESAHYESWRAEAELLGVRLDAATFGAVVGAELTDPEVVEILLGAAFVSEASGIAARARHRRHLGRESVGALPGSVELIRDTRRAGLALGLVSGSPASRVLPPLRRLGIQDDFQAIVCGDDVAAKPAPDGYLAALRALDTPAERAVAIEDSGNGARAAIAAGLRCIAVPHATTRGHDFAGCALTLPSLHGVTVRDIANALSMTVENTR